MAKGVSTTTKVAEGATKAAEVANDIGKVENAGKVVGEAGNALADAAKAGEQQVAKIVARRVEADSGKFAGLAIQGFRRACR